MGEIMPEWGVGKTYLRPSFRTPVWEVVSSVTCMRHVETYQIGQFFEFLEFQRRVGVREGGDQLGSELGV